MSDTLRPMTFHGYETRTTRRSEAHAALVLLLADCAPADRDALATDLIRHLPEQNDACPGLYTSFHQGILAGACWGQLHRGRTGSVWRPRFSGTDIAALGVELMRLSAQWLVSRDVSLIQSLVVPDDAAAADWLEECGFAHHARLGYLVWSDDQHALPEGSLRFTKASSGEFGQFAQILERSYQGTLDCPSLNGLRTTAEVIDGYRELGETWSEGWLIAWRDGDPIGCLILADHPASNQCELVYMGLVPEVRGQALGGQLACQAKRLLRQRRRGRLVLAVDLQNAPAVKVYRGHGFICWDQRDVFVRAVRAPGVTPAETKAD